MKNLDLNNCGVQEMNAGEMRENNGGSLLVAAIIVGAIIIFGCGVYAGYREAQAADR